MKTTTATALVMIIWVVLILGANLALEESAQARQLSDGELLCLFKGDTAYDVQAIRNKLPQDDYALFEHNAKLEMPNTRQRAIRLKTARRVFENFLSSNNPFLVSDLIITECMNELLTEVRL